LLDGLVVLVKRADWSGDNLKPVVIADFIASDVLAATHVIIPVTLTVFAWSLAQPLALQYTDDAAYSEPLALRTATLPTMSRRSEHRQAQAVLRYALGSSLEVPD
jgi:hypothetical protein